MNKEQKLLKLNFDKCYSFNAVLDKIIQELNVVEIYWNYNYCQHKYWMLISFKGRKDIEAYFCPNFYVISLM